MEQYKAIVPALLEWYDNNARVLPWRQNPAPYYVWVSEIMLQQTRVEAVKDYFLRFIEALPDIKALAEAEEEKLLKLWEGLGYYNRVRNLQEAAKTVVSQYGGELPADYEELRKLKGIGSYTAGAIASISFQIPVPAVDGNVLRVMKRISGSYEDISKPAVKKQMEQELRPVIPKRAGAFNQAIMDLGAMVCIPNGKPLCEKCPLTDQCVAYKKNIQMELPVKSGKKARRIEEKTILLLEYQGKYALQKRKETGLLAGLWELPNLEGTCTKKEIRQLLQEENEEAEIESLGRGKHIFSHVEWRMTGYHVKLQKKIKKTSYVWATEEELQERYAIPAAFSIYLSR